MNEPASNIMNEIYALYNVIRGRIFTVLAVTALCAGAMAAYLIITPRIYTAKAIIQVEQSDRRVVNIQEVAPQDARTVDALKTVEARLSTDALLLRVIKTNHLDSDADFMGTTPPGSLSEDRMIKKLRKIVSAKLERSTRLIDVTVDHQNPVLAQKIAASIVKELMLQNFELAAGISGSANQFLMKQADELKGRLEKAEKNLQNYREEHQAASLLDKQDTVVQTLKDLNKQVADATSQRVRVEADLAQLKAIQNGKPEEMLAIPAISMSPDVQVARKTVADQEAQLALLSKRYRAEHPAYIQAKSELQQAKADLDQTILKAGAEMESTYAAAKEAEAKTKENLAAQEKVATELNRLAIPYNAMASEVDSDNTLYQSVISRMKETEVTKGLDDDNIRVIQEARVPETPSKPKVLILALASVAGGFLLGVGIVLGSEALDGSFKTLDEVEAVLGVTAAGAVPKVTSKRAVSQALLCWEEPDSPLSESFRSLRANILLAGHDRDNRSMVFTSASPGAGKSFCSTNYATVLAHQGYRTVLIDAELRQSTISSAILGDMPTLGLGEYLSGKCTLEEIIMPTRVPNLFIIPVGCVVPNPAEMLASDRGVGMINSKALAGFDRIVIDSAPLNAASDMLPILKAVKQACFVVPAGKGHRREVIRAYELLARVIDRKAINIVVNQLPLRSGAGCYYHYMAGKYGNRPVYGKKAEASA